MTNGPDNLPVTAAGSRPLMERLGAAGPYAVFTALVPVIGSLVLMANAGAVSDFLRERGAEGWFLFVAGFAVLAGFSLLPTYVQSGLAGYIFGLAWGASGAVLGCVLGAITAYALARVIARDRINAVIEADPRWRAVRDELVGEHQRGLRTLGIVTLLRLPPNSPFAITNLLLTSVRVPFWIYVVGTAGGIAPRTVLAAWIGAGIRGIMDKEFKDAWSDAVPRWVFWGGVGLALVVVIAIGGLSRRALARVVDAPGQPGVGGVPGAGLTEPHSGQRGVETPERS